MGIYVYVQLIHFVTQQKLTHIVKQLYSNKDVKKKKEADIRKEKNKKGAVVTFPNRVLRDELKQIRATGVTSGKKIIIQEKPTGL